MTLNELQLAAIVIVCGAIAFVGFSSWLLLRIYHHAESSHASLLNFLEEIRQETRGYKQAERNLSTLLERADKTLQGIDPEAFAAQLEKLVAGMQPVTLSPEMAAIAQDGFNALQSVAEMPPEGLAAWQADNRVELNRLMTQKTRLESELDSVRGKLKESDRQIRELRRQNRDAEASESAAEQLRNVNQRLIGDLRDTRRRVLELEAELEPMVLELQKTKARLAAQPHLQNNKQSELEAENKVLQERSAILEASVRRLEEEALRNKEELSRTLREKSFIEERFLEIETG